MRRRRRSGRPDGLCIALGRHTARQRVAVLIAAVTMVSGKLIIPVHLSRVLGTVPTRSRLPLHPPLILHRSLVLHRRPALHSTRLGLQPWLAIKSGPILHRRLAGLLPWHPLRARWCASLIYRRLRDAWATVLCPSHPAGLPVR